MAEAKIIDAETLDEALAWLKPRERMVMLNDRALLSLAMRLKS
jgi:membrane glycosyltransferase